MNLKHLARQLIPSALHDPISRLKQRLLSASRAPSEEAIVAPPEMWALVGAADADYVRVGQEFKAMFIAQGLKPHHAILDVGCGIGRAAAPLVDYLDARGRYCGFDVMGDAIDWCRANIADPRFSFIHSDIHSDRYNPAGPTPASAYRFPYADASFDFVWLGSVFTHLLPADQQQFAREIARVLKPGGTSLISWYLLDDAGRAGVASGESAFDFSHQLPGCWTSDPELPESAIAYDIEPILDQYDSLGFDLVWTHLGVWREQPLQDQDLIAACRR